MTEVPPVTPPNRIDLVRGTLGFALLGLAAGVGSPELVSGLKTAPTVVVVVTVPLVITIPSLVVMHQFGQLRASPEAITAAAGRGLVRAGQLAAGLAPVVLFLALTSDIWRGALLIAMAGCAAAGLETARATLVAVVRQAGPQIPLERLRMGALASGWMLLCGLVGLRMATLVGM